MQNYSAGVTTGPRENRAPQFEPVNLAPSAVFIAVELAMTYWLGTLD